MFNETQIGCTADCHVGCPEGTYRLPGMVECKPRLNCDQIRNLTKGRNLIGGGGVKRVNIEIARENLVWALKWLVVKLGLDKA